MENPTNPKDPKPKKQKPAEERIALSQEAGDRLGKWVARVSDRVKTRVTKSDLAQWLILGHPLELSDQEISAIEKLFFDEIKYAEWIVKTLKEARQSGKPLEISDLIPARRPSIPPK